LKNIILDIIQILTTINLTVKKFLEAYLKNII